jgi:hypothetical protein
MSIFTTTLFVKLGDKIIISDYPKLSLLLEIDFSFDECLTDNLQAQLTIMYTHTPEKSVG